jgi:hypothetical protein
MDRDIVERAMKLSGEGLRIAQIARQLGVNRSELRREIAEYDGFGDCTVIVPDGEPLGETARNALSRIFQKINRKIDSPSVPLSELTAAASVCYRIYKEESADAGSGGNGSNDPVARLFGDEIKLLKEK